MCEHFQTVSPENAECAWCVRHRINLDRTGRLCARCRSDPAFRAMLERQSLVRFGGCGQARNTDSASGDARPEATSFCEVFAVATDEAQCARCRSDAEFRAFLHGQWLARRAARAALRNAESPVSKNGNARARRGESCPHRGALLRHDVRKCCGGKERRIAIYACARLGETHDGLCAECELS